MEKKTVKTQRIPKDATIGDLVAFAESIGCRVEVYLKPRDAEQCVHPSSDGEQDDAQEVERTTENVTSKAATADVAPHSAGG